jgi:hypothetical protein
MFASFLRSSRNSQAGEKRDELPAPNIKISWNRIGLGKSAGSIEPVIFLIRPM